MLRTGGPPNRLGYVGYALAAYVLIAAASLFWSVDRDATAYAVAAFTLPLGILAALTGALLPVPPLTRVLPSLLIVVALVLAAVAFWQWHMHEVFWNDKLMRTNAYGGYFRTNSLLFDPSLFGRVEVLALVTIAGLLTTACAHLAKLCDEHVVNRLFDAGCTEVRRGAETASELQNGQIHQYLRSIGLALVLFVFILAVGCNK